MLAGGLSDERCFLAFIDLQVLGRGHAIGEGGGERAQCGLPPHCPACLRGAFGVHPRVTRYSVVRSGLLGREVPRTDTARRYPACRDSIALVLNKAYLELVGEEGNEFRQAACRSLGIAG